MQEMKAMFLDDNMSNLTSASNEAASLSSSQHSFNATPITSTSNNQSQTNKKKRNLPGNPDPEAEVIAMSPKTLMATNRFVCEICSKGFQRDQNLQLHRRGHNLPWKLKQRSKQEVVRKKVYVCPEPSCVHHEPARALGDLTGIKKHYSRKHGEKKWKCEKCSKRYAVQSDWKAHSKICGTREYRCDCGTLFSRRDSFITHRAFCGALAGEAARSSSSTLLTPNHLPLHLPLNFPLKTEPHLFQYPQLNPNIMSNDIRQNNQLPSWFVNHHQPNPNPNNGSSNLDFTSSSSSPHMPMSASALLQKAAQIGESMNKPADSTNSVIVMSQQQQQQQQQHQSILSGSHQHGHMYAPTSTLLTAHHHNHASGLENLSSTDDNQQDLLGLNGGFANDQSVDQSINAFQEAYNGTCFQEAFFPQTTSTQPPLNPTGGGGGRGGVGGGNGNDELTRDFLGLTGDQQFLSMAGLDHLNTSSSYDHNHQLQHHDPTQNQNQLPWDG